MERNKKLIPYKIVGFYRRNGNLMFKTFKYAYKYCRFWTN